ncbi:MAG: hypothetical protein QXU97_05630 [Fervidicoccaceae archaeon]
MSYIYVEPRAPLRLEGLAKALGENATRILGRYMIRHLELSIGTVLLVVTPADFSYERIIISPHVVAIEHREVRKPKVNAVGPMVEVVFK